MRKFLYKSSFIRFYVSLMQGKPSSNSMSSEVGFIILFSLLMLFGMGFATLFVAYNEIMKLIGDIAFFSFIFSLIYGMKMRSKPNMASIQPISHAKKSVWFALSPLFSIFIWMLFMFVVALIFFAIIYIILACIGNAGDVLFNKEGYNAFASIGSIGGLFAAFYMLVCYGVGIAAGLTERKLYRYTGLSVFVISNALTFILVSAFTPVNYVSEEMSVFGSCSPFLAESYNAMPNLWVVLVVFGIAAAALSGLAVYKLVTYFKPKKY